MKGRGRDLRFEVAGGPFPTPSVVTSHNELNVPIEPDYNVNFQCPSRRFTIEEFESGLRDLVLTRLPPQALYRLCVPSLAICRLASLPPHLATMRLP